MTFMKSFKLYGILQGKKYGLVKEFGVFIVYKNYLWRYMIVKYHQLGQMIKEK